MVLESQRIRSPGSAQTLRTSHPLSRNHWTSSFSKPNQSAGPHVRSPAPGCALKKASLSRLEPLQTMSPPSWGPLGARFRRPWTHWRPLRLGDWSTCGQGALDWRSGCGRAVGESLVGQWLLIWIERHVDDDKDGEFGLCCLWRDAVIHAGGRDIGLRYSLMLAPSKDTRSSGVSQIFAKAFIMAGSLCYCEPTSSRH